MLLIPRIGTSLAVSHWKLRMVLILAGVPIQPSRQKQAIFRTGFDFTVFFSGFYSLSLSGRLRAVGLSVCLDSALNQVLGLKQVL